VLRVLGASREATVTEFISHGDWVVALATLAAAFFGTAAAFLLELLRRHFEARQRRVSAINRALYALFHYWNTTIHHRVAVVDPVRAQQDAWLNASTIVAPEEENFPIDNGHLDFLLNVGTLADLFAKLHRQEQQFRYAVFLMNERTRCARVAYRVLGEKGAGIRGGYTEAQYHQMLGTDRVIELRILFDGLVKCLDESIPEFESTFQKLRVAGKSLFWLKVNLIDCEFVPPPAAT
jgi:hypothetical protein